MAENFPKCIKCDNPDAVYVPLSDFGGQGHLFTTRLGFVPMINVDPT